MDGEEKTRLRFVDQIQLDEYMLFELPDDVLDELLSTKQPGAFQIRGHEGDKAVLVSPSKSFSVRKVESTNFMLLSPPKQQPSSEPPVAKKAKLETDRRIEAIITCHYEISQINPDVTTLRKILLANPYKGDDDEDELGREQSAEATREVLYNTKELRKLIQASDEELYKALAELSAIEIDGQWRLLDPDYSADIFDNILTVAEEKELKLEGLEKAVILDELKAEYPENIIAHVLRQYSKKTEENSDLVVLDEKKTCVFRALQLFAEQDPFPNDDFMEQWGDIVPYGMTPTAAMLTGFAISQPSPKAPNNKSGLQWKYFPLSLLAPDAEQRFQQLFTQRERWKMEDIEPYTKDLAMPGQKFDQFLMKHARSVTTKGNVLYTKLL